MNIWEKSLACSLLAGMLVWSSPEALASDASVAVGTLTNSGVTAQAYGDGSYSISGAGLKSPVIHAAIGAVIDSVTVLAKDYPQHAVNTMPITDALGTGSALTVTYSGLAGRPDMVLHLRLMQDRPWGEVSVTLLNTTGHTITVQSIRPVQATGALSIDLGGRASDDRILSDSYSEDRPQLAILDLQDGPKGMHRAVGSQLIYNRASGKSLFLGALTSERFLTIFHLKTVGAGNVTEMASYAVDSTGTTEILREESLRDSPPAEQVELSVQLKAGESLSSERLMFAVGDDYYAQLEQYGEVVRTLHKARVDAATPIGWWSWTAYYFGVNQETMATNADWLAANLKGLGYNYFQIDEGYQYARGEYIHADAARFPKGLGHIADYIRHDGLTFGLWTAPFEVSERASVYAQHKDWLLHNAAGQLIHIGHAVDDKDALYVLDTTNPGAQQYLAETYSRFRDWGVRFIKMDFMDDSAAEGAYYQPNTSAMQAQRIGLQIIRDAVGEEVILDKDGSVMLNPVGIVDAGRISQDTGHTFEATRDAASGIAARYYMNRNFYIADPDAFTVSSQRISEQTWHGGQVPLSLDEAKMSIALSAVSGGMFEIGDDLPTLGTSAERMALVKNRDLLDMAHLGHASIPIDLLSYQAADKQPSEFFLKENARQSILTVFNWTEAPRDHALNLQRLGLNPGSSYQIVDVLGADKHCCAVHSGTISVSVKPRSVLMLKIIDKGVPTAPLPFIAQVSAGTTQAGSTLRFKASITSQDPLLNCHWDFGDGTSQTGITVDHAYTRAGHYAVTALATGLNGITNSRTIDVTVDGTIPTLFNPSEIKR